MIVVKVQSGSIYRVNDVYALFPFGSVPVIITVYVLMSLALLV